MHVRITWGRVKPGAWDDYEAAYTEMVSDGGSDVPGLLGRLLLRDTDDRDAGGTLSLWDTEQAARDYETSVLRQDVLPQLQQHFSGDYVAHVCEVRLARGELAPDGQARA